MGNNSSSIKKINFEDMQSILNTPDSIIINTLDHTKQQCLILHTVQADKETDILNNVLRKNMETRIVLYGMNACDEMIVVKYNQLIKLGFSNVLVYPGGLFEWLLLQDIYGEDNFPTTKKEMDILRFKGKQIFNKLLIH